MRNFVQVFALAFPNLHVLGFSVAKVLSEALIKQSYC